VKPTASGTRELCQTPYVPPVPRLPDRVVAFAPGRANVIGEHTDYNDGLSLPFAIGAGVRVSAAPRRGGGIFARALDRGESEIFPVTANPVGGRTGDWRDFVRGTIAELEAAGLHLRQADLEIEATLREGLGLSSSAALEAALALALVAVAGLEPPGDRMELARLCSRVESRWVGARTGLLDQIASLFGERDRALRIDFRTLDLRPVPLHLGGWRLVAAPSGEARSLVESGYNERRSECERARELLGLESVRDADRSALASLPAPLGDRVRHVLEENARVDAAVSALERGDLVELGRLLDASHRSLRDLYDSSTPAVEATVARLKQAGAAGARILGGGFGGSVLALFPPGAAPPADAIPLEPSQGARLLAP
jgi:galactokinase